MAARLAPYTRMDRGCLSRTSRMLPHIDNNRPYMCSIRIPGCMCAYTPTRGTDIRHPDGYGTRPGAAFREGPLVFVCVCMVA